MIVALMIILLSYKYWFFYETILYNYVMSLSLFKINKYLKFSHLTLSKGEREAGGLTVMQGSFGQESDASVMSLECQSESGAASGK